MIKFAYCDHYRVELPENHRFPMLKYELIREQALYEGFISPEQLFVPELVDDSVILAVHDADYWQRVKTLTLAKAESRLIGFPQTESLVKRSQASVSGAYHSALNALNDGLGINISGGTHHAFRGRGEGFCVLNDVAVSSQYLLDNGLAKRILVVDLDVHQGNGTAAIFAAEDRVFTYSMHCEANYPLRKERSDLDVPLPVGAKDSVYLTALTETLPKIIESYRPDFVFYLGGVDILATDALGKLQVSQQGCAERDFFVFSHLHRRGLPVAAVMGGGYSPRLNDIVSAHCTTYKIALDFYD